MGKGAQDPRGHVVATGDQRQARQTDHGVAAPVAKPGIAGDDRTAACPERSRRIGLIGQGAADDELVGSQHQVLHPGRRVGVAALRHQPPFVCLPFGIGRRTIQARRRLSAGDNGERLARMQHGTEVAGVEVVVQGIQPATFLDAQEVVLVPFVLGRRLGAVAQPFDKPFVMLRGDLRTEQVEGHRPIEGHNPQAVRYWFNAHLPVTGVGVAVMIPVIDDGLDAQG